MLKCSDMVEQRKFSLYPTENTEGHMFRAQHAPSVSARALEIRNSCIIEKYGAMTEGFQSAYESAINQGDSRGAMVALDRWRFSNLPREEQLLEQEAHRENFEDRLKDGVELIVRPDDLVDLIKEE